MAAALFLIEVQNIKTAYDFDSKLTNHRIFLEFHHGPKICCINIKKIKNEILTYAT